MANFWGGGCPSDNVEFRVFPDGPSGSWESCMVALDLKPPSAREQLLNEQRLYVEFALQPCRSTGAELP